MTSGRLAEPLRRSTTLIYNSGAMAAGSAVTAVFGFAYWSVAARFFPPEVVGTAMAILSVMGLIGLVGEAGLGTLLFGEIMRHPGRASGLVAAACSVGIVLSVVAATFYLVASFALNGGELHLIHGPIEVLVFLVGAALSGLSIFTDTAFTGMLRTTNRFIRQALFSIFKVAFLVLAIKTPSVLAILLSWVGGMLASWIGLNIVSKGDARRILAHPDFRLLYGLRGKAWAHYRLDLALQAPGVGLPYVVLLLASPSVNAAFSTMWMVITMVNVVPAALATVLFPAVRADPEEGRNHVRMSLAFSLAFALICGLFFYFTTDLLLGLFNPLYRQIAAGALDILGFSLIGSTMKMHACTIARLNDSMAVASRWFAVGAAIEIGACVVGSDLGGIHGLVIGWTAATTVAGAFVLARAYALTPSKAAPRDLNAGAAQA